jgi:3-oxoacyl-[acyl-carrier protein] reductase
MHKLEGRAALITGGSRGIGAAIARRFAQLGAAVAITYFNTPDGAQQTVEECRGLGARATEAVRADAGNAEQVKAAVRAAFDKFGRLDILVNNSGICTRRLLSETTEDEFDRTMDVNVKSVYVASKEAATLMDKGGRIINMGSTFGSRLPAPGLGLYAASKFAGAGLPRAFARDLAGRGITVNAIQPGPINTDMNRDDSRHSLIMTMMTALGRYGQADEVAQLAAFLASSESNYITGAVFNIDGGFEA